MLQNSKLTPPNFAAIKNPKLRAFYERGWKLLESGAQGCIVRPIDPEFAAWEDYFRREVGVIPYAMRLSKSTGENHHGVTMPTQWPEWFDTQSALRQAAE